MYSPEDISKHLMQQSDVLTEQATQIENLRQEIDVLKGQILQIAKVSLAKFVEMRAAIPDKSEVISSTPPTPKQEAEEPATRRATTYQDYVEAKAREKAGKTVQEISDELDIKLATVRSLLKWDALKVAQKKARWEQEHGPCPEPEVVEDLDPETYISTDEAGNPEPIEWHEWSAADRELAYLENEDGYPDNHLFPRQEKVFVKYDTGSYSNMKRVDEFDWTQNPTGVHIIAYRKA